MATLQPSAIQSPLQLFGFYLAWTESALAVGLFATKDSSLIITVLGFVMAFGLVAYVLVASFLIIYLVLRRPEFLFNPSNFHPSVQHLLFGPGTPQLTVGTPAPMTQGQPAQGAAP
jgi:hypothetical protein